MSDPIGYEFGGTDEGSHYMSTKQGLGEPFARVGLSWNERQDLRSALREWRILAATRYGLSTNEAMDLRHRHEDAVATDIPVNVWPNG